MRARGHAGALGADGTGALGADGTGALGADGTGAVTRPWGRRAGWDKV
ncbi:hypothetical protein GCM10009654_32320 [Streptomyces hebeiensis]|uniref:Uncharacterized protein n=1 Tax=Streptomyces hebeiensis TaxID=229486 RepID=A0ABN1UX61_9ACTN